MLSIFRNGVGGGAIGVPLYGTLGGYALSGRGPRWARIACRLVALTAIPIWALTVASFAGPRLALHTARGAWVAVYCYSFLALLALAAPFHTERSLPARRSRARDATHIAEGFQRPPGIEGCVDELSGLLGDGARRRRS